MAAKKQIDPLTYLNAEHPNPCEVGRIIQRYLKKGKFKTASDAYNKASRRMQKLLWSHLEDITQTDGAFDFWDALDRLDGLGLDHEAFSVAFKAAVKRETKRLEEAGTPKRLNISITRGSRSWIPPVYEITVKRVK